MVEVAQMIESLYAAMIPFILETHRLEREIERHKEEMRRSERDAAIEVEARWVDDVAGLLEASKC